MFFLVSCRERCYRITLTSFWFNWGENGVKVRDKRLLLANGISPPHLHTMVTTDSKCRHTHKLAALISLFVSDQ